ncbi:MAG: hypothetical protein UHG68_01865 [Clostridia bacterium]|nr:hypothetical protein [Clostridia bacterium]
MNDKSGILAKKNLLIVIAAVALGVLLLFFGSSDTEVSSGEDNTITLASEYRAELERTAASMCASIKGVESAQVNITLEGGMAYVYAKNSEGSYGGTYFSSGGDPLLLQYDYPQIIGCAVVCSGAVSTQTKLEITQMMSAYLGISTSKIYVGYKE